MKETMKVKILRDTVADSRPVYAGSVEELSEHDARILIALGKAEPDRNDDLRRSVVKFKDAHKGAVIAILGGGPSLPDDLKQLPKDAVLISINHHAAKLVDCPYMAFLDNPLQSPHLKDGLEAFDGVRIGPHGNFSDVELDVKWDGSGFTSGFALWLARYMGAATVITCGMDCYKGESIYFHDDEPGRQFSQNISGHLSAWRSVAECNPGNIKAMSGPLVDIFGAYSVPRKRKKRKK